MYSGCSRVDSFGSWNVCTKMNSRGRNFKNWLKWFPFYLVFVSDTVFVPINVVLNLGFDVVKTMTGVGLGFYYYFLLFTGYISAICPIILKKGSYSLYCVRHSTDDSHSYKGKERERAVISCYDYNILTHILSYFREIFC